MRIGATGCLGLDHQGAVRAGEGGREGRGGEGEEEGGGEKLKSEAARSQRCGRSTMHSSPPATPLPLCLSWSLRAYLTVCFGFRPQLINRKQTESSSAARLRCESQCTQDIAHVMVEANHIRQDNEVAALLGSRISVTKFLLSSLGVLFLRFQAAGHFSRSVVFPSAGCSLCGEITGLKLRQSRKCQLGPRNVCFLTVVFFSTCHHV